MLTDDQIKEFYPFVKKQALDTHIVTGVNDVDDLIQEGFLALLERAARFDPSRGASFKTFAFLGVKNAMIDKVRKDSPLTRLEMQRKQQMDVARRKIENKKWREATHEEVTREAGLSVDVYDKTRVALMALYASAREEKYYPNYDEDIDQENILQRFYSYVDCLPERRREAALLYFCHGKTPAKIGVNMGVTESRVSQIIQKVTAGFIQFEFGGNP